jgi:hypothetical protein
MDGWMASRCGATTWTWREGGTTSTYDKSSDEDEEGDVFDASCRELYEQRPQRTPLQALVQVQVQVRESVSVSVSTAKE